MLAIFSAGIVFLGRCIPGSTSGNPSFFLSTKRRQSLTIWHNAAQCNQKVIDYLADLWRNNSSAISQPHLGVSFYGGEPLMNMPLIEKIVDYVQSLQLPKKISFSMTSNCVLLDKYMDYLVEKDFQMLCSLDGDNQSDAYRVFQDGRPSFNRVFTNLKLLQNKYPSYFAKRVQFNAVLHNLNSVSSLFSFFKDEFGKVPTISELNSVGVREDQKEVFNKTFKNHQQDLSQAKNQEELRKEMKFDTPETNELFYYFSNTLGNVYDTYLDLLSPETEVPRMPTGTCLPFSKKLFVKVDGKIMHCERIHHNFYFGAVRDGKVNLDLQDVADRFNAYIEKIKPICQSCAGIKYCMKCFYTIDGLDSKSVVCDAYMNRLQLKQLESHYKRYLFHYPTLYREFMNEVVLSD